MARVMATSEAAGMDRLVLLVMANRAGGDLDECFASVDRLAFECRIDVRTVQRAVKRLSSAGDLVPGGIHTEYRTNIYRVMPIPGVAESHPPGTVTTPAPPKRKKQEQTSIESPTDSLPQRAGEFDRFWKPYPRKVGKRDARGAFVAAARRAPVEDIIAGAERLASDRNLPEQEFIPYPAKWLRRDGWEDPPLPSRNGQRPRHEGVLDRMARDLVEGVNGDNRTDQSTSSPPVRSLPR
jgi:helix-turn-helix protein